MSLKTTELLEWLQKPDLATFMENNYDGYNTHDNKH